jgi:enterochelin esterase-like enzyme
MNPMVIVMPYGHGRLPEGEKDGFSGRGENTQAFRRDLLTDVIPLVQEEYSVSSSANKRGIVGLSMGGGQSVMVGLNHPEMFRWMGAFSSAVPDRDIADQLPEVAADPEEINDQMKLIWIACGRDDFLWERNQAFVGWLEQTGVEHDYQVSEGGHDWIVWREYLAEFLPLLF